MVLVVLALVLGSDHGSSHRAVMSPRSEPSVGTAPVHLPAVPGSRVAGVPGVYVGNGTWIVTGVLVRTSPRSLTVRDRAGKRQTVSINPNTDVCRGPCSCPIDVLRPGDLIDANLIVQFRAHGFGYRTRWVDANSVSDYAHIDAIEGYRLTVHSVRHDYLPNPPYTLVIDPDTIIQPLTAGGPEIKGQLAWIAVGDKIYFTGSNVTPNDMSVTVGTRIFPLFKNDGTIDRD